MRALVISGGGSKGAFAGGIAEYLISKCGIRYGLFVGTSTGSLLIPLLAIGEISKIKKDAEVTILVKSINQTLKGKVAEVSLSAKHTGGQYLVKIALHKTETPILSGMFASVQFPIEQQTDNNLVLVPTQAIITNGQLSGIYTISQNNTAILRWLRLGKTYGDQVEVLSGLSANESYIISSEGKLFNGAKISVH